jgi:hypothetical protein
MAIVAALVGVLLLPAGAFAGRAVTEPCQTVFCAGVSGDGSRVVFPFEEELTAGAGHRQIYERSGGAVRPLLPPSTGYWPQLDGVSADATHVFVSTSVPLSPADTDGSGWDVYDLAGGVASLVSTGPLDPQTALSSNRFAGASPDGSRVFFESFSKLTADDLDECPDLYQRAGGVTTLVGPNPDPPQLPLCEWAEFGGVSGDGSHVFFVSGVELEPGDEEGEDIYQQVGTALTRLTTYPEPEWNCVESPGFVDSSSDGGTILFTTNSAIVPEDTDRAYDLYKRRPDGTFVLVSRDTPGGEGCGFSGERGVALSADGHSEIFETSAQLSPADHDSANDLYRADDNGEVELVSTGPTDAGVAEPTNVSPDWLALVSDDAKVVAFETRQQLVAADKDGAADVYVRVGGRTELVSAGQPGRRGRPAAELLGLSGDGSTVVFATREQLVAKDTDSERDIYLRRLGSKHPILLSAETIPPPMRISRHGKLLPSGEIGIRIGCPKTETSGPCHGEVKLAKGRRGPTIGKASFRIPAGKRMLTSVRPLHSASAARHAAVFVRVRGIDRLGNAATATRRVTLLGH